jgi:tRNA-dihydrouridine synthase
MIARGAIGNPWIFRRTKKYLETGVLPPEPSVEDRLNFALLHARRNVENKGEARGIREIRKHMSNYTRGLWCGTKLRHALMQTESYEAMEAIVVDYLEKEKAGERG